MGHGSKTNTMKLNRDRCEVLCLALVLDRPGLETHICLFCLSAVLLLLAAQRMLLSGFLEGVKCKDSELTVWGWVEVMHSQDKARNGYCERSEPMRLEDLKNTFCIYEAGSVFSKQEQ